MKMKKQHIVVCVAITLLGCTTLGCASAAAVEPSQNDPFEKTNRAVFDMNIKLDKAVAKPVAKFYVRAVPEFVRTGIHNLLANFEKPVVLGNDVLQAEGTRAGQTFTRMMTNAVLGLGGLIDVATMAGVPDHDEDFGQTLAVWGLGEGSYLMLPFLGPSNPRDAVGKAADYFIDPLTYAHYHYENVANGLRMGFGIVDLRAANLETLDAVERSSIDFYATTRSLYRQHRKSEIANGRGNDDPGEDIDVPADDTTAPAPSATPEAPPAPQK
jgi:phospholipid-binding lipoprotein MlaA